MQLLPFKGNEPCSQSDWSIPWTKPVLSANR